MPFGTTRDQGDFLQGRRRITSMNSNKNIDQKQPMNGNEKGLNLSNQLHFPQMHGDRVDGWDEGDEVYSQTGSIQNSTETESSTL